MKGANHRGRGRTPRPRRMCKWALRTGCREQGKAESFEEKGILGEIDSLRKGSETWESRVDLCTREQCRVTIMKRCTRMTGWQPLSYQAVLANSDNKREFNILPSRTPLLLPLPTPPRCHPSQCLRARIHVVSEHRHESDCTIPTPLPCRWKTFTRLLKGRKIYFCPNILAKSYIKNNNSHYPVLKYVFHIFNPHVEITWFCIRTHKTKDRYYNNFQ